MLSKTFKSLEIISYKVHFPGGTSKTVAESYEFLFRSAIRPIGDRFAGLRGMRQRPLWRHLPSHLLNEQTTPTGSQTKTA